MAQLLTRRQHGHHRLHAVATHTDMPSPSSISSPIHALTSQVLTKIRSRRSVLRELADHIEDHSSTLRERGVEPTEARAQAVRAFGDARTVAAQVERIRNQGSWPDVAMSAFPSLFVAILFVSNRWLELEWIVGTAAVAMIVSVLGVYRFGRRAWVFSWLGYALFPILLISMVSLGSTAHAAWSVLSGGYEARDPLSWILGIGLGVAGLVIIVALMAWLSRKDWIHAMLVVLPMALLSVAILAFDRGVYTTIEQAQAQNAVLFGAFAIVVAAAVRMTDRLFKIGLLAASLPLGFLLISGGIDIGLRIIVTAALLIPALLLIIAPYVVTLREPDTDERLEHSAWPR
ncbi:MAG: hypothetical protein F4X20_05445 [Dehalococcoidia bacterium]|nr:hypothetical protein [Dehalococcoidia bacterium]